MSTMSTTPEGDVQEGGGRKPWLLIGGGVAAAVLVGGGAFAVTQFLGGGGDRPDAVLPGNATAYLQVDLDPSVGEKVAAVQFFQGLDPEIQDRLTDGDWRQWVWEQIENENPEAGGIDFEQDIEPWLGDRAGVAVLPAAEGEEPAVAVALQVEDGDAAMAFFDEHATNDEVGYYLESDYMVFSEATTLDAVQSAAGSGTLSENDTYTSDMSDLGDAGIMAAWGDLEGLSTMDPSMINPALGATEAELGMSPETPEVSGRMAGTVRLNSDSIEIHGLTRGMEGVVMPESGGADLVTELPADTAVALSVEDGAAMVQAAWDFYAEQNPEEVQQAEQEAQAMGFALPDDLQTVLGDSMAFSVGPDIVEAVEAMSPTDSSVPPLPVAYRVTTDTERLQAMMNENGVGAPMTVVRDDEGTLTVGTDQGYVDAVAGGPGDTLGDSELFDRAVADAGDAQMALYVDLTPFQQYYLDLIEEPEVREGVEKLAAVGLSSTAEGEGDGRFTLRFVAGEE